MNPYHDPNKSHHRPHGFQNNYLEFQTKSLSALDQHPGDRPLLVLQLGLKPWLGAQHHARS